VNNDGVIKKDMNDAVIDGIIERALVFMPNIHKRLYGPREKSEHTSLTRHQLFIMKILNSEGSATVSYLAKIIGVPNPQMTRLVNQLVEVGYVTRNHDIQDRRLINLSLTGQGKKLLLTINKRIKEHLKQRLAVLTTKELLAMSTALETLQTLVAKL
jgi:DNA-binding MarR family transcriptional regulator